MRIYSPVSYSPGQLVPESRVFRASRVIRFHEHLMMLTAYLIHPIAHGGTEILIRGKDLALGIKLDDRKGT
jgi:hypothetical protein